MSLLEVFYHVAMFGQAFLQAWDQILLPTGNAGGDVLVS